MSWWKNTSKRIMIELSLDFKISYYASIKWFEAQWIKLNKGFQILSIQVMSVQEHSSEGQIYVLNNRLFLPLWFELFFHCYGENKNARKKSCCLAWKFGVLETRGLISRISFLQKNATCPYVVYIKCTNCFFLHPLHPWERMGGWEVQT